MCLELPAFPAKLPATFHNRAAGKLEHVYREIRLTHCGDAAETHRGWRRPSSRCRKPADLVKSARTLLILEICSRSASSLSRSRRTTQNSMC